MASIEAVGRAESALGFALPPLLRRLYLEVGNGGFGPGFGLFGVEGGHLADICGSEATVDAAYAQLHAEGGWPAKLLPICDWGGAIWSCVDCRSDAARIVTQSNGGLWILPFDLRLWLDGVDLDKEMFDVGPVRVGINPFTRQPLEIRGLGKPKGTPWG